MPRTELPYVFPSFCPAIQVQGHGRASVFGALLMTAGERISRLEEWRGQRDVCTEVTKNLKLFHSGFWPESGSVNE